VAHACNPSYLRGRDQDCGLRQLKQKSKWDPISTKTTKEKQTTETHLDVVAHTCKLQLCRKHSPRWLRHKYEPLSQKHLNQKRAGVWLKWWSTRTRLWFKPSTTKNKSVSLQISTLLSYFSSVVVLGTLFLVIKILAISTKLKNKWKNKAFISHAFF
jgi:hypothetical protein